MSRKVALSPLQGKLLRELEEAGEETVACLKATLRADEQELDVAIQGLENRGFVVRRIERHASAPSIGLTRLGRDAIRH